MHGAASLAAALIVAGCAAPSYQRSHDMEATLPRAIGLGAFASNCLFFCYVEARFMRGGDEAAFDDSEAGVHSRMESELKGKLK